MLKFKNNQFTKRELELLVMGLRIELDEAEKNLTHVDGEIRTYYKKKQQELYLLWDKIGENGVEPIDTQEKP